jgi:hypothetical protein
MKTRELVQATGAEGDRHTDMLIQLAYFPYEISKVSQYPNRESNRIESNRHRPTRKMRGNHEVLGNFFEL